MAPPGGRGTITRTGLAEDDADCAATIEVAQDVSTRSMLDTTALAFMVSSWESAQTRMARAVPRRSFCRGEIGTRSARRSARAGGEYEVLAPP